MAAELLGQVVQTDPAFPLAYFNRALVYEKLFLYTNAKSDWEHYLKLDAKGPWAEEAREHLADIERKIHAANPATGQLAQLAEVAMEAVMRSGLTSRQTNPLAAKLFEKHQDRWLADAIRAAPALALNTMPQMVETRMAMRIDRFPRELEQLNALRRSTTAPALTVWLDFERLFRVTHSPGTARCLEGIDRLVELSRRRQYAWLLTQILLERSTCEVANGRLAVAEAIDREALGIAILHQLPVARLRAAGFLSFRLATSGAYREAAQLQRDSLALFWSRPFPYGRGQEFYYDMDWVGEGLERFHIAKAAAEAAATMANWSGAVATEAVNRARWAGYAERLKMPEEAREQYSQSMSLFDRLEKSDSTQEYRAFAETFLARTTGDRGALARFEPVVRETTDPIVVVPYLRIMAAFDETDGRIDRAKARLTEAIRGIEKNAGRTAPTANIREWRLELQGTYRDLVAMELNHGDATNAYRHWQELLASDSALRGYRSAGHPPEGNARPAALFTYARLGDRYAVWMRTRDQLLFTWLNESSASIDQSVREYLALCSHPEFTSTSLRTIGSRLRSELLDPLLGKVPPGLPLLVQPDGSLSALAWSSLPVASGGYIGDRFTVAVAPLAIAPEHALLVSDELIHRALVVGANLIAPDQASNFLPLPGIQQELASVRYAFPSNEVLEGGEATAEKISAHLRLADALHFAGHAMVIGGEVRLLVAPDTATAASTGFWQPSRDEGSHLRLAVLSACSTAKVRGD